MNPLGLEVPRLSSNGVCCPECHQRVTYRPDGLTDRHEVDGLLCPAAWPPYVRATKSGPQPMPLHALLASVDPL